MKRSIMPPNYLKMREKIISKFTCLDRFFFIKFICLNCFKKSKFQCLLSYPNSNRIFIFKNYCFLIKSQSKLKMLGFRKVIFKYDVLSNRWPSSTHTSWALMRSKSTDYLGPWGAKTIWAQKDTFTIRVNSEPKKENN